VNPISVLTLVAALATTPATKPTTTGTTVAEKDDAAGQPVVRFVAIDVYVDSKARPLAAYQFELKAPADRFTIVGVEGGEHKAFAEPPYYDPAALSKHRIIIAALDIGKNLPTGKTRVARIHARVVGEKDPCYEVKVIVAASPDGSEIPVTATAVTGGKS
jgi:hypothetical protein